MVGNDYLIGGWVINYEVSFGMMREHEIRGELKWLKDPDIQLIMQYIRDFYENTGTQERIREKER